MPSAKEEANKIAADVKEATNESASDLSNAMGGGCSPQLTEKVLSSLTSVQGAVSKIQSSIGGTVSGLFMDDNLRKIYENAKKTNDNALLNEYIAEQNAMFNENKGYTQYDELLKNDKSNKITDYNSIIRRKTLYSYIKLINDRRITSNCYIW